jgi:hypothetical protein
VYHSQALHPHSKFFCGRFGVGVLLAMSAASAATTKKKAGAGKDDTPAKEGTLAKAKAGTPATEESPAKAATAPPAKEPPKRPADGECDVEVVVPAKVQKTTESAQLVHTTTKKPKLPTDGDVTELAAREVMKSLVPWVVQMLERFLKEKGYSKDGEQLATLVPLAIAAGAGGDVGVSYKETWSPANCRMSMTTSGMYEAGGSLFWMNAEVVGAFSVPCAEPSWNIVNEISKSQFVPVTPKGGRKRIIFPVAFSANSMVPLPEAGYPVSLQPLGGHAFIYGWYVRVFRAFEACDDEMVRLLVEAALTITLCVWSCMPDWARAVQSIKLSESMRVQSKVMIDSFLCFMDKINMITNSEGFAPTGEPVQDLVAKDIRFNGGLINASMMKAMGALGSLVTPECRELCSLLERRFGYDVLTGSYNKLRMLANGCQKQGTGALQWALETMYIVLLRGTLDVSDFKNETFLKGRDGSPSWITVALTQRVVVQHLCTLAEGVGKVDPALAATLKTKVMDKLASPMLYNAAFPTLEDNKDDNSDADAADGQVEARDGGDFIEELGSSCPRAAVLLAETVRKVFDGNYDDAIAALCGHASPETALADIDADTLKAPMATDFRDLLRSMHAAESVVKAGGSSLPAPSLRELVRQHSDGADPKAAEAERADVWKRAQAQRKKLISLGVVKDSTKAVGFQECLKKKGGDASKFVGKLGEEHRMFVASADLVSQSGADPWIKPSIPDAKDFDAMLTFLSGSRGVGDITCGFDGCIRSTRRTLEDNLFNTIGNYSEVVVVYTNSWNDSFKKKIFLGSDNIEVGFVSMPTSRTRCEVKVREGQFTGSGETSSHFRSLSGAKMPARMSLPRISHDDKVKIFPEGCPQALPKKWTDVVTSGQPLFWQETKPQELWSQLLSELNVKCVVDLTPGAGALAIACMDIGIIYFGMCRDATHQSWLSNVLDRAALKFLCKAGAHLYQEDLATHIRELFADVLNGDAEEVTDEGIAMSDDED